MSINIRSTQEFDKAYSELNTEQRKAVDVLEGPLMVIAGPGTGKTQILAIRIGNILLQTDTDPKNILCLTYTESGATAMRQRLIQFIGPTAYEVTICTFHSFCNAIIRENPDVFEQYSDYEVISELEKSQLLLKILEGLDRDDVLYKYHGKYDHEFRNLSTLFDNIKKENWKPESMIRDIDRHIEEMRTDESMFYKKKTGENAKGDFNEKKYQKFRKSFERTKSGLRLYFKYQEELDKLERYEYEDMIQWVIQKFESDEDLLLKYQEKFQYILVDEYQDTNGAQNKILFHLLSFFESANVFAVGDDDQAIYRFQGANVQNMMDFDLLYHPQKIVLVNNYRSTQIILDSADSVIEHNKERLINKDSSLSKKLRSSADYSSYVLKPVFSEYQHPKAEVLDITNQIEKLMAGGTSPNEIAILFRKNADAEPFIKLFESKNIPYQTNRQINILDDLLIGHILNIVEFIVKEYQHGFEQDGLLFKILHAPYIPLQTEDLSRLAWYLQNKRKDFAEKNEQTPEYTLTYILGNEPELKSAGISNIGACIQVHKQLNSLNKQINDFTPQGMLEKILQEFNILHYLLTHKDKIQLLQIVNSFFEFLKNETRKNAGLNLIDFMNLIDEHHKNNIVIANNQFIGTRKGVNLSSIHGSKGLEYEYVFMINNSNKQWTSHSSSGFKLPPGYLNEEVNSDEDNRRLFYVGLTRAKLGIYVSYHIGIDKKPNTVCKYVTEMLSSGLIDQRKHVPDENELVDQLIIDLSPLKKNYEALENQLFEKFIERFRLNPTALTKYLDCPLSFYYEKVLQVPGARTAALGFGNAVHYALELFMRNPLNLRDHRYDIIQKYFQKGMEKYKSHFTDFEYNRYFEEGTNILPGFLETFSAEWSQAIEVKIEQKINTEFNSIPISGKLDRIDKTKEGTRVIDYKTGKPDPKGKVVAPNDKYPNGSDYWLQMIFYAILLKHQGNSASSVFSSGSNAISSAFYFVNQTSDKTYEKSEVSPTSDHIQKVEELISSTYEKIKNKQFTPGCGKPTCEWCRYVNSGVEINLVEIEEEFEEDE
jgi:DNA helicase-2/ATP-dependent DNA helicase PcrA